MTCSRSLRVTLAMLLLYSASADWKAECDRYCTHTKNDAAAEALVQHCETYRYVLPKPKVYQKCERAFKRAVADKCGHACKDLLGNFNAQEDASHHCKSAKNEVPRPISHEACMKGYTQGTMAVLKFANDLKAKAAAAKSEDSPSVQQTEAEEAQAMAEAAAEAARQAAAQAQAAADAAAKKKAEQAAQNVGSDDHGDSEDDELAAAREAARAAYAAEQAKRKAGSGGVSNEL